MFHQAVRAVIIKFITYNRAKNSFRCNKRKKDKEKMNYLYKQYFINH